MAESKFDTSGPEKLMKQLKEALNTNVRGAKAGYLANDKGEIPYDEETPPTLEEIALWNEFGTETIPARPFLTRAQKSANLQCQKLVKARMEENADVEQIAKEIGAMLQDEIQQQITKGNFRPNAKITLDGGWMRSPNGKPFYIVGKKNHGTGSTHPLIDTGNLRQSVHWGLVTRDGDKLME